MDELLYSFRTIVLIFTVFCIFFLLSSVDFSECAILLNSEQVSARISSSNPVRTFEEKFIECENYKHYLCMSIRTWMKLVSNHCRMRKFSGKTQVTSTQRIEKSRLFSFIGTFFPVFFVFFSKSKLPQLSMISMKLAEVVFPAFNTCIILMFNTLPL